MPGLLPLLPLLPLFVGDCVDLSRPTVLLGERDAPVFGERDAAGGAGGTDASARDAPDRTPTDPDADGDTGPTPDGPELDVLTEAPVIDPPDVMPDLPLVQNGKPCDQNAQCASNVCSNGVCCDRACTTACFACNLAGTAGTCSPVPAGEDPGNHCTQADVATCGQDGTCDGSGGCRRYRNTTECAPGRCSNATEFPASRATGRELAGLACRRRVRRAASAWGRPAPPAVASKSSVSRGSSATPRAPPAAP